MTTTKTLKRKARLPVTAQRVLDRIENDRQIAKMKSDYAELKFRYDQARANVDRLILERDELKRKLRPE